MTYKRNGRFLHIDEHTMIAVEHISDLVFASEPHLDGAFPSRPTPDELDRIYSVRITMSNGTRRQVTLMAEQDSSNFAGEDDARRQFGRLVDLASH
ncbi:hypothetical protein [Deinococcus pimensis]|uniref:hypothetical protein n=1 Tax=Deinococcus pimensis TaxID=309888 RepID=UPI000483EC5E|nr:hypothetical protein [Deinococcus pimensis]